MVYVIRMRGAYAREHVQNVPSLQSVLQMHQSWVMRNAAILCVNYFCSIPVLFLLYSQVPAHFPMYLHHLHAGIRAHTHTHTHARIHLRKHCAGFPSFCSSLVETFNTATPRLRYVEPDGG